MAALVLLCVWLAACGWFDVRTRRIPNSVTIAGLALALIVQVTGSAGAGLFSATERGAIGILPALTAAVFMLVLGLILWRLRLFGAGDAKMLVAVAAWVGPPGVVPVLLLSLCSGGLLAVMALIVRKLRSHTPYLTAVPPDKAALSLPYSLAIMAGTLGYIALVRWELWGQ